MKNPILLSNKISSLNISIEGSWVEPLIQQLYAELEDKGIHFRPHIWISNDWFCPDGVPGFAIPFYLLNRELQSIEREELGDCEAITESSFMRYLRHETGHALDNAFKLRNRIGRKILFGSSKEEYPESYTYRISRKHVDNLGLTYGSSHPDEDFAETFAVWLDPDSNWQNRYENKPKAFEKLIWMDACMRAIRGQKQLIENKRRVEAFELDHRSLRAYYEHRRRALGLYRFRALHKITEKQVALRDERQAFVKDLNQRREQICKQVQDESNRPEYIVHEVYQQMVQKIRAFKLVPRDQKSEFFQNFKEILKEECKKQDNPVVYMG